MAKKKDEGWNWVAQQGRDKNQWIVEGYDESKAPPRIKRLDPQTYACYRDGNYLGGEKTLELAKQRCLANKVSERNSVVREWEKKNPDELPPGLAMTEAERKEWWRRHPPRARAAAPTRVPGPQPGEDPATAALRASLVGDNKRGRGKAAPREKVPVTMAGTIRVLGENPKKPGSGAHARWANLLTYDGKTVDAYKKAKGNMTTLANAIARGTVRVEE